MKTKAVFCTFLRFILLFFCVPVWAEMPNSNGANVYVGLNTGLTVNSSNYSLNPVGDYLNPPPYSTYNFLRMDSAALNNSAFIGGGQFGIDYKVNRVVFGLLELAFDGDTLNESSSINRALASPLTGNFNHTVTQQLDFLGMVRSRFGLMLTQKWMVYGIGGLAYGHLNSSTDALFTEGQDDYASSVSVMRTGYTVGGGLEFDPTARWGFQAEYNYVNLGSFSYESPSNSNPGFSYSTTVKTIENEVVAKVNYYIPL